MRAFSLNDFWFILMATRWTVVLSLLSFALGGLLGAVIAILRISRFAPLRLAAAGYVQLFQGTPLLMQLFLIYYGLSLFGLRLDAWTAVTIAYTVYAAAFLGDIWRGCIQAIPKEQWEASRALALQLSPPAAAGDHAPGGAHRDPADGRLPRAAREGDRGCVDHRLRRADARRTTHDQCDVPADDRLSDRRGTLLRAVLAAVGLVAAS